MNKTEQRAKELYPDNNAYGKQGMEIIEMKRAAFIKGAEFASTDAGDGWKRVEDVELFETFDNDFEMFPLPICFDPDEELKELHRRESDIKEFIKRLQTHYRLSSLPAPPQTDKNQSA